MKYRIVEYKRIVDNKIIGKHYKVKHTFQFLWLINIPFFWVIDSADYDDTTLDLSFNTIEKAESYVMSRLCKRSNEIKIIKEYE